ALQPWHATTPPGSGLVTLSLDGGAASRSASHPPRPREPSSDEPVDPRRRGLRQDGRGYGGDVGGRGLRVASGTYGPDRDPRRAALSELAWAAGAARRHVRVDGRGARQEAGGGLGCHRRRVGRDRDRHARPDPAGGPVP